MTKLTLNYDAHCAKLHSKNVFYILPVSLASFDPHYNLLEVRNDVF